MSTNQSNSDTYVGVNVADTITAIDLFCGAGGFSKGLKEACNELGYYLDEAAINHWDRAIETHENNNPFAEQYHSKVEQLHPPDVLEEVSGSKETNVELLVAGPECTHHSRARGGKPVKEQRRMSPWLVLDWLEKLNIDKFIIENVPEIQSWGPVDSDGQPIRDGSIFSAWVNALNSLGYAVDWKELTAKDYGDPTSRKRFFIMGTKEGKVTFPNPTHSDTNDTLPDYRKAADVIDWDDLGDSIWTRDITHNRVHTPPAETTLKRIGEGIKRHCSEDLLPFADTIKTFDRETIKSLRENRVVPRELAETFAKASRSPFLRENRHDSTIN